MLDKRQHHTCDVLSNIKVAAGPLRITVIQYPALLSALKTPTDSTDWGIKDFLGLVNPCLTALDLLLDVFK